MVTFASGLRNPEAWPGNPRVEHSGVAVNERDEIDSDRAPGSMTLLQDDAFHGSPYNYYG